MRQRLRGVLGQALVELGVLIIIHHIVWFVRPNWLTIVHNLPVPNGRLDLLGLELFLFGFLLNLTVFFLGLVLVLILEFFSGLFINCSSTSLLVHM